MSSNNISIRSGRTFLSTMKTTKSKIITVGLAAFMAVLSITALTPTAFASTGYDAVAAGAVEPNRVVPNRFNCSEITFKCVQINGSYVPGLPHACHWVSYSIVGPYPHSVAECHPNLWW